MFCQKMRSNGNYGNAKVAIAFISDYNLQSILYGIFS